MRVADDARQLHAYAWATEPPDGDFLNLGEGLFAGAGRDAPPTSSAATPPTRFMLPGGRFVYRSIPRDDAAFEAFLCEVLRLLS